jgi:hypothetical protein
MKGSKTDWFGDGLRMATTRLVGYGGVQSGVGLPRAGIAMAFRTQESCILCDQAPEQIDHLLVSCVFSRVVCPWTLR